MSDNMQKQLQAYYDHASPANQDAPVSDLVSISCCWDGTTQAPGGDELPREGDLRELGVLAVYLASLASDYMMTGQIIYVDGGLPAK